MSEDKKIEASDWYGLFVDTYEASHIPDITLDGVSIKNFLKLHKYILDTADLYNYVNDEIMSEVTVTEQYGNKMYDFNSVSTEKWLTLTWKIAKVLAPPVVSIGMFGIEKLAAAYDDKNFNSTAVILGDQVVEYIPKIPGRPFILQDEWEKLQRQGVGHRMDPSYFLADDLGTPSGSSSTSSVVTSYNTTPADNLVQIANDSAYQDYSDYPVAESGSDGGSSSSSNASGSSVSSSSTGSSSSSGGSVNQANKAQSKNVFRYISEASQEAWKQVEKDAQKHLNNVLKGTESFSHAFNSVWQAMVQKTEDILKEKLVSRIQAIIQDKIISPLAQFGEHLLDSIFGNLFASAPTTSDSWAIGLDGLFGGVLAKGGPVKAGKTYIVGEKGPELFTSSVAGTIIPNDKLAIGQSQPVTVNIINKTGVQASAKSETKFDGQRYVVDVFLDAYARNVNGMRDVLAARR